MSSLAVSPVAVDISRLLEPKGSTYPPPSSQPPSSIPRPPQSSPERIGTGSTRPHLAPAHDPRRSEHLPPPAAQPGYAPAGPPHEGTYPPPGVVHAHPHVGYGPANAAGSNLYDSAIGVKRPASQDSQLADQPPKKQSKWTSEENDLIIRLRGDGMKWDDVSKHLPGRSAISCRLHYQNFLERRPDWDEEKKNKLARLYERFRREMWERVAKELKMPWRAAEDMHWQMGRNELAQRAGVQPFHAAPESTSAMPAAGVPITTSFAPTAAYQPQVYSASPQSYQPGAPYPPNTHAQPLYTYPQPSQHAPYPAAGTAYSHPPPTQHPNNAPTSAPAPVSYGEAAPPAAYRAHSPPREPAVHSRRSESIANSPVAGGAQAARLSPGSVSPRRRALSGSRLSAGSIPPMDARSRTPPQHSTLPSLQREYYPSPPLANQRQQLPPVRFLTEEQGEDRRPADAPPANEPPTEFGQKREGSRDTNGYPAKTEERDDPMRRSRG